MTHRSTRQRAAAIVTDSVGDLFRDPRRPRKGDTVLLGLAAIVLLSIVFLASIATPQLWYVLRTADYTAEFANVGGVREGDPVVIAGVPAGRVGGLSLGDGVAVAHLRVDRGFDMGTATTATIGLQSVLGNRFVEITPAGPGAMEAGDVIPLERTTSPYTLDDLGESVTELAGGIDTERTSAMINTLDSSLPTEASGESLDAIADALDVLASDADRIDGVVRTSRELTGVLVEQEESLQTLTNQAHAIVTVLAQRREQLSRLVSEFEQLSGRIAALLAEESDDLDRVLGNMRSVSETYRRNIDVLDETLTRMPPSLRAVADATGNGPWTDVSAPSGPIPDSALCAWGVLEGC